MQLIVVQDAKEATKDGCGCILLVALFLAAMAFTKYLVLGTAAAAIIGLAVYAATNTGLIPWREAFRRTVSLEGTASRISDAMPPRFILSLDTHRLIDGVGLERVELTQAPPYSDLLALKVGTRYRAHGYLVSSTGSHQLFHCLRIDTLPTPS